MDCSAAPDQREVATAVFQGELKFQLLQEAFRREVLLSGPAVEGALAASKRCEEYPSSVVNAAAEDRGRQGLIRVRLDKSGSGQMDSCTLGSFMASFGVVDPSDELECTGSDAHEQQPFRMVTSSSNSLAQKRVTLRRVQKQQGCDVEVPKEAKVNVVKRRSRRGTSFRQMSDIEIRSWFQQVERTRQASRFELGVATQDRLCVEEGWSLTDQYYAVPRPCFERGERSTMNGSEREERHVDASCSCTESEPQGDQSRLAAGGTHSKGLPRQQHSASALESTSGFPPPRHDSEEAESNWEEGATPSGSDPSEEESLLEECSGLPHLGDLTWAEQYKKWKQEYEEEDINEARYDLPVEFNGLRGRIHRKLPHNHGPPPLRKRSDRLEWW
jgi:hypothetical protein